MCVVEGDYDKQAKNTQIYNLLLHTTALETENV